MRKVRWPTWAACGCICAGLLGCDNQVPPRGIQLIQEGTTSLQSGDYQGVIRRMDELLRDYGSTGVADRAYYLRGEARYRLKDYGPAKADFEGALDRTHDKSVRGNTLAALGDLAWDQDDTDRAETMYRRALADLPEGRWPIDQVHLRLGCVLQRLGRWQDADVQFNRLAYFFQGTEVAREAGRRVNARAWTVRAGAFATRSSADSLARRLQAKELPAAVEIAPSETGPQFVVQVGRYQSYGEAAAQLANVKAHQGDAAVMVTR